MSTQGLLAPWPAAIHKAQGATVEAAVAVLRRLGPSTRSGCRQGESPPEAYDPETFDRKCEIVFNQVFASYFDDGRNVYDDGAPAEGAHVQAPEPGSVATLDVSTVTEQVLEQIKTDAAFAELVAEKLKGKDAFFAVPSEELLANDETYEVEFKSTARWNLRESHKDRRMEDAIVKTIAAFLNADGGTLFIGVDDERSMLGLAHDCVVVRPANADGLVNWLTTHLITALRYPAVMRTRTRIESVRGVEICRIDVARSSVPVRAKMSDKDDVFWVRMNNTTREWPEEAIDQYARGHWGDS